MSKRIAVVQSSYVPWKGYFDLIAAVDEFVLYDDAQYTKRDWRNRNRIKTPHGSLWLTIPVSVKGRFDQRIRDTAVSEPGWQERHWRSVRASYARAACFRQYEPALERMFAGATFERLSEINRWCLSELCGMLGIDTRLTWSMDYRIDGSDATGRLIQICQQAGATRYLSGPSARAYIDASQFERAGITVEYMDYSGYTEYVQLHPPFDHAVSVIDLLVHTGARATAHMLCANQPSVAP